MWFGKSLVFIEDVFNVLSHVFNYLQALKSVDKGINTDAKN
jgi:hypothetical protein